MNTSTFWSTRVPRALRRLSVVLAAVGLGHSADAQSFLRADGPRIVNASNQEVILNGMNLGNWAVQEGYMMKVGWPGLDGKQTQGKVKKTLYNAGMSDAAVETFYQNYRNNFITKPDLDYIASKGFNCVRLPLHYELFLTPAQRAVRSSVMRGTVTYDSYVSQLTGWYNNNQLFTDPNNMEALRMIDNTLAWAQANNMYVVLDMHAVPGSQGTDANIADQIVANDLWNRQINQDVLNRLWAFVSNRYKNDARVAMYDLINEPNNFPNNQKIHDVYQRLITTIRGNGDNHLLLLEGNGWGNDYNYMEPFTFSNRTNLVYNSHRYSGGGYEMDNGVNSTGGSPNTIRFIGDLRNFRTTHNVPVWIGETGENSDTWMREAAKNLNSVGIGWCHWTYKRFENISNPAFMHINPPYVVDGPSGLNQVLTNIQWANCVPNTTVAAVSPNQNGIVNYPGGGNYNGTGGSTSSGPAIGRIYEISSKNGGKALEVSASSQANGGRVQQWGWVSAANQKWKLVDAGSGYVRIVNVNSNKSLDVAGPSTADGALTHQWDWLTQDSQYWQIVSNGDGTYRIINKYSGKALDVQNNSTADGAAIQQWTYGGGDNQRWWFSDQGAAARVALATTAASAATDARLEVYPTVTDADLQVRYTAPASQNLNLRLLDLTGRVVINQANRAVVSGQNLITVPIAAVKAGVYLIQVDTPEGRLVRRVVVAH
ncbi:Por secretion system C-terminal sorting domain-containing protein [Hymenobacter gelipurpurascens]|uniref:Por secretion system C-terminal sorting domain-containing protein n=1 Tax=Hymenobacter gelipurpurascens TaxID=89968 RepID=A0A212UHE6_9BACT|nr:RICIN domain-containing protein [Hymenobacter gelipurpurascens]SNC77672.1 Por secretion system C-terminal sorting domain-containing protein [Hymenobacter gelipurpurascens]